MRIQGSLNDLDVHPPHTESKSERSSSSTSVPVSSLTIGSPISVPSVSKSLGTSDVSAGSRFVSDRFVDGIIWIGAFVGHSSDHKTFSSISAVLVGTVGGDVSNRASSAEYIGPNVAFVTTIGRKVSGCRVDVEIILSERNASSNCAS
eukprot:CAMPEP_0201179978 /NCGR_PEP_ID=MMETSP0851-20130426/114709_1 /ASSEMBLY_ACC=CAM_ASM_000631 /TAXON_ID=183588 /ORGANISM="Pseudo-nitzschia fraudulenta, Strain WWA7" /LENGTH=147 /DNA_ID=CAMNT_0047464061 /DNA_START=122 /DNA_END=562 /DNA_ORIENTATION=-